MRRWAVLALLTSAGCSTAPIADMLDHYYPSDAMSPTAAKVVVISTPIEEPIEDLPKPPRGILSIVEPPELPGEPIKPTPPEPEPEKAPQPKPLPNGVIPAVFRSKIERLEKLPVTLPSEMSLPR